MVTVTPKTGLIGYGSMGSMLITSFLQTGVLPPESVIISTRNKERCAGLLRQYPAVTLAQDNRELAQLSSRIILGVKPLDILSVVQEIADLLDSHHHLISMAGCVQIRDMEEIYSGRITRILPSLTNMQGAGCILCCHNAKVSDADAREIESLFSGTGKVVQVREDQFEAAGDLMSCAPALLAAMIEEMALAGMRHSTLTRKQAEEMAYATLHGTGLLLNSGMPVQEIIRRVATPGGITEEGVKVLRAELPPVYDHLFEKTLAKHAVVQRCIEDTRPAKNSDS